MCTVDQRTCTPTSKRLTTFGSSGSRQQCPETTARANNTAARVQHCIQQGKLLWIFHGSGALPNQGHLQATAVNNRQRTWSQNTGGFSTTLSTTHKPQWQRQQTTKQQPWQQHTSSNWNLQHMMATMPHMKNGNTSSQHTWAYMTHSIQGCSDWPKQQHNKWLRHT